MHVFDPTTWTHLESHPTIKKLCLEDWREEVTRFIGRSPDADLQNVRNATLQIRSLVPSASTKLVVDNSVDWYVAIESNTLEGDVTYCDEKTVCLRLDMGNRESLYVDDVPVEKVGETIKKHFGI